MNIRFETLGCRLNQIESESAARSFSDCGFSVILDSVKANSQIDEETILCVINTCAVTQKAEQKDRRIIRLCLEKCPNATVVVTGCYAQLSAVSIRKINERLAVLPGLLKSRIAEVAIVLKERFGNTNSLQSQKLPDFDPFSFAEELNSGLFSASSKKQGISENPFLLSTDSFLAHSRSSIKIQDGCNNCCSYCTIHTARGHSVSLVAKTVIERVMQLEQSGQTEIVFTGVNIGQYKSEYEGVFVDFTKLLALCLSHTKKVFFRISSIYPEIVTEEFCSVISNVRVRPHFHLSVQSGSNSVLKRMRRNYSSDDVRRAVRLLRAAKENPFIACDIITGFPAETDTEFNETLALCKDCNFSWIHVFPFSARPGTEAAGLTPKIPQAVSGTRAKIIADCAVQNKREYIKNSVGKTFYAVLEHRRNENTSAKNGLYTALTENFLHCRITNESAAAVLKPGSAIRVRITECVDSSKGGETDCLAYIVE